MKTLTRQTLAIFGAVACIIAATAVTATPQRPSAGLDFHAHQGERCVYLGQIGLNTQDGHANYCIDGKWTPSAIYLHE